ncbi:putative reverse transcriptase domain-containing protein [Tanacetum coccineum]
MRTIFSAHTMAAWLCYFSYSDSLRISSEDSMGHLLGEYFLQPDLPSTSAGLSRKRLKDSGYLADVEVDHRETSLRDDAIVRVSDEPHLEQDSDPEIQAEIDECFAYADALRDRGIEARVVVEAIDRDETETGVRGPVEVRVERVTHLVPEDIPEPAQEGAVEVTYETLGDLVQSWRAITGGLKAPRVLSAESCRLRAQVSYERELRQMRRLRFMIEKMPSTRSGASMTREEFEEMVTRRVAEEMEAREAARTLEPLNENGDELEGENGGNEMEEAVGMEMEGMEETEMENKQWESIALSNWNAGLRIWRLSDFVVSSMVPMMKKSGGFIGGYRTTFKGCDCWIPSRLQDAIRIANQLMDKKVQGYATRSAENKRRMESNLRDNRGQQPPFKRQNTSGQNVARAYTAGNNERKGYVGFLPYCNKCRLHHEGLCTMRCGNCKKVGHQTRDCRAAIAPNTQRLLWDNQQDKKHEWNKMNQSGGYETSAELTLWEVEENNPDSNVVYGPMTKLTQKSVKFEWGEKAEAAFQFDFETKDVYVRDFGLYQREVRNFVVYWQMIASRVGQRFWMEREKSWLTHPCSKLKLQPYSTEEADYEEKTVVRIDERDYDCEKSISPGKATRKEENFINEDLRGMINKLEPRADGTLGIKSIRSWIPYLVDLGPDMYIPALSCSVLRRLSWREIAWLMKPLAIPSGEVQDCTTIGISLTKPVEIMDREVKCLKQSHILIVKVRWNSKRGHEFTWER